MTNQVVVDPKSRLMEMKSINLTFCSFVNMKEQMSYFPHPEDPFKTMMRQETIVTVKGVPLTRYIIVDLAKPYNGILII